MSNEKQLGRKLGEKMIVVQLGNRCYRFSKKKWEIFCVTAMMSGNGCITQLGNRIDIPRIDRNITEWGPTDFMTAYSELSGIALTGNGG